MQIVKNSILVGLALLLGFGITAQKKLDLNNPEHAVKAMRKVQSSLKDGEEIVYWWEGNVYSRIPGEKDRLLFTYQAMNIRATKTLQDKERGYGFQMVSRELLLYLDPKTGEVLDTWQNPFTGEEVKVIHVNNDPVNSRYPTFAKSSRGDYRFPGKVVGGTVFLNFEIPLFYTNPLGGDYQEYVGGTYQAMEMFFFSVSEEELCNAKKNTADDVVINWARISKWLPWMKMNDRVGQLIFSGSGKKLENWDKLPEILKKTIKEEYPIYVSAPSLDDQRPNQTSWTVFKEYIDQKRSQKK